MWTQNLHTSTKAHAHIHSYEWAVVTHTGEKKRENELSFVYSNKNFGDRIAQLQKPTEPNNMEKRETRKSMQLIKNHIQIYIDFTERNFSKKWMLCTIAHRCDRLSQRCVLVAVDSRQQTVENTYFEERKKKKTLHAEHYYGKMAWDKMNSTKADNVIRKTTNIQPHADELWAKERKFLLYAHAYESSKQHAASDVSVCYAVYCVHLYRFECVSNLLRLLTAFTWPWYVSHISPSPLYVLCNIATYTRTFSHYY